MATYNQIQQYIKNKYEITVKTCWIAHMKEKCGLPLRKASNRISQYNRTNPCPQNKEIYILDAFKHYKMI